jgi:hypothetical protein
MKRVTMISRAAVQKEGIAAVLKAGNKAVKLKLVRL